MADLVTTISRLEVDSDKIRVYPNANVKIRATGTSTPDIWSGTADANGKISVSSLDTGHYDLIVNDVVYLTWHHVKAHPPVETWQCFVAGTIADFAEDDDHPIWCPSRAGKIVRETIVFEEVTAGSGTLYLLGDVANGGSQLTFPASSQWGAGVNPTGAAYRWKYKWEVEISIAATWAYTIGFDVTSGTFKGMTVILDFIPDLE